MNRDKVPTSCCDDYGNCNQGRNCPVRISRLTTDGGDWVFFDKTSEVIFWAGAIALVMAFFRSLPF